MQLLDQVVPPNLYFNQLLDECYPVTDPTLGSSAPYQLYLSIRMARRYRLFRAL